MITALTVAMPAVLSQSVTRLIYHRSSPKAWPWPWGIIHRKWSLLLLAMLLLVYVYYESSMMLLQYWPCAGVIVDLYFKVAAQTSGDAFSDACMYNIIHVSDLAQ